MNTDGTVFAASDRVRVITDDGRDAVPGSDDEGLLMVTGHLPLRYHNDPDEDRGHVPRDRRGPVRGAR